MDWPRRRWRYKGTILYLGTYWTLGIIFGLGVGLVGVGCDLVLVLCIWRVNMTRVKWEGLGPLLGLLSAKVLVVPKVPIVFGEHKMGTMGPKWILLDFVCFVSSVVFVNFPIPRQLGSIGYLVTHLDYGDLVYGVPPVFYVPYFICGCARLPSQIPRFCPLRTLPIVIWFFILCSPAYKHLVLEVGKGVHTTFDICLVWVPFAIPSYGPLYVGPILVWVLMAWTGWFNTHHNSPTRPAARGRYWVIGSPPLSLCTILVERIGMVYLGVRLSLVMRGLWTPTFNDCPLTGMLARGICVEGPWVVFVFGMVCLDPAMVDKWILHPPWTFVYPWSLVTRFYPYCWSHGVVKLMLKSSKCRVVGRAITIDTGAYSMWFEIGYGFGPHPFVVNPLFGKDLWDLGHGNPWWWIFGYWRALHGGNRLGYWENWPANSYARPPLDLQLLARLRQPLLIVEPLLLATGFGHSICPPTDRTCLYIPGDKTAIGPAPLQTALNRRGPTLLRSLYPARFGYKALLSTYRVVITEYPVYFEVYYWSPTYGPLVIGILDPP
ncbi:hypothetical protein G9A89_000185 [Geosiphon pyriformis]|nr:hypothetical protein G9A89_000185 [Geosiphon pyriformis]